MQIYNREYVCPECESTNVVERWRWRSMPGGGETEYPVAACRTCGAETSL